MAINCYTKGMSKLVKLAATVPEADADTLRQAIGNAAPRGF